MHVPPPDFRHVGIEPGPPLELVKKRSVMVGFGVFATGLAIAGRVDAVTLSLATLGATFAVIMLLRRLGPVPRAPTRMSIVPWGVLLHLEPTPRVLRWAAVREVQVELVHEMDHATPSTRWSVVTIRTERESYAGRAAGDVSLERLQAHLERYADEGARPIALDLDGQRALDDFLDPVFERLLQQARRLLGGGQLGDSFLPPTSYRNPRPDLDPRTRQLLDSILCSGLEQPADPRPLALVVAAELGQRDLLERVLELTSSPSPVLAAVARAAGLRLGADVRRTGALDEIDEFLPEAELSHIKSWAADVAPNRAS